MTNADIQVGEYVRTKKHGIFKVTKLYEVEDKYYILNNDKYEAYTIGGGNPNFDISKYIINHDFSIIKLIEEGDYVNGMEVDEFDDDEGNLYLGFGIFTDSCMDCIEEIRPLSTVNIKTIVTKEQFKAMEYKVGGEDD